MDRRWTGSKKWFITIVILRNLLINQTTNSNKFLQKKLLINQPIKLNNWQLKICSGSKLNQLLKQINPN